MQRVFVWILPGFWLLTSSWFWGVRGECVFPQFLYAPLKNGSERYWLTRTEYHDKSTHWNSQYEIRVKPSVITTLYKVHATCGGFGPSDTSGEPAPSYCTTKRVLHTRTCVRKYGHGKGKYIVQHEEHGNHQRSKIYSCIQFIKRNNNLIQVKLADLSRSPDDDLCNDIQLNNRRYREQEWPWLAPEREEWSFCPVVGGFDFRLYTHDRNEALCEDEWRPSRVEMECIHGEGMLMTFPRRDCNPFSKRLKQKLQCWASWKEAGYLFIVAAIDAEKPRYVMRLPADRRGRTFEVHLYFSVVCPINPRGDVLEMNSQHHIMKVRQSATSLCYDESQQCDQFHKEGKCLSAPPREYANHCMQSCGLCELMMPSKTQECTFGIEAGDRDWLFYNGGSVVDVTIEEGRIKFSDHAHFYCKSKHWDDLPVKYKVLSTYENGCRPRFSCMKFMKRQNGLIEYEILRSDIHDESLDDMCRLEGGQERRKFRYSHMNTLLLKSMVRPNSCSLGTMKMVNTVDGFKPEMKGIVTDLSLQTCKAGRTLKLSLNSTNGRDSHQSTHTCHAYITIRSGLRLLMAYDVISENYRCWIIKSPRHVHGAEEATASHEIYVMRTAYCGHDFKSHSLQQKQPWMALTMKPQELQEYAKKPCEYIFTQATQGYGDSFLPPTNNSESKSIRGRMNNADFIGSRVSNAMTSYLGIFYKLMTSLAVVVCTRTCFS